VGDLVDAALRLRRRTAKLEFGGDVAYVYRPLEYAWPTARAYLAKYGRGRKELVFVGMNPGPFGMGQTGVPFGDVGYVRDWLKLDGRIGRPEREHPKRRVQGLACTRSEVSGRRLWGAFAKESPNAEDFFARAIVINYCPLLFLAESGANITPDKLPAPERRDLERACDAHLAEALDILTPRVAVGVGRYAEKKILAVAAGSRPGLAIACIPHPSPASPAANRGWEKLATKALRDAGIDDVIG
jgi:single-strand selective monofunctional uracil DNA glycosylase